MLGVMPSRRSALISVTDDRKSLKVEGATNNHLASVSRSWPLNMFHLTLLDSCGSRAVTSIHCTCLVGGLCQWQRWPWFLQLPGTRLFAVFGLEIEFFFRGACVPWSASMPVRSFVLVMREDQPRCALAGLFEHYSEVFLNVEALRFFSDQHLKMTHP